MKFKASEWGFHESIFFTKNRPEGRLLVNTLQLHITIILAGFLAHRTCLIATMFLFHVLLAIVFVLSFITTLCALQISRCHMRNRSSAPKGTIPR